MIIVASRLADQDSAELARRIRAERAGSAPRLALCSRLGADSAPSDAAAAVFDATLLQPLRRADLIGEVAALVAGLRWPTATADPTDEAALSTGRVLLVEDNEINGLLATTILEGAGFAVSWMRNGAEAVDAVRAETFEVILMDVQMPVMDGLQATRLIRSSGARLPILAMTANAMAGDRQACLDAGMDDCISKPIDITAFMTTVAQWVA